jgi:site-specific recombinase XerC
VTSTTPAVTLGTAQLAFVRAWAEGIAPATAWARFLYLEGAGDARSARRELNRILEELRRTARLHGRPDLAALLLRDPEAIVDRHTRRPSLEQFRQGFDDDFYSESELLKLYEERYGRPDARSSARRRQRLRERLLEALLWLQERATRAPRSEDPTKLWFDHRVAQRLENVGIHTLGELHAWIASRGFHWHRSIPRLGAVGAQRMVRWLKEHEDRVGALPLTSLQALSALDVKALVPAAQVGVVPIERLRLPDDERNGRQAVNRAPAHRCKLAISTDLDAVLAWLSVQAVGSHTWRAYRREAERWLLWAVFERRKALSALDGLDCERYRHFLAEPAAHWTGRRQTPRWSRDWRPLEGPLSASSRVTAEAILRTLCDWLVRHRYLDSNPWDDAGQPDVVRRSRTATAQRTSTSEDGTLLNTWLERRAPSLATLRLSALVQLAAVLGLPMSTLAAARLTWLRPAKGSGSTAKWALEIPGSGRSSRRQDLTEAAFHSLQRYLASRDVRMDSEIVTQEGPLFAHLSDGSALSASRLSNLLTTALRRCAESVESRDGSTADRL